MALICRARKLPTPQNQAFCSSFFLGAPASSCTSTARPFSRRSESSLPSSTYPSFSNKTLEEPFQVNYDRVHNNYDPVKPILVESIRRAVSRSAGEQAATTRPLDYLADVKPNSVLVYSVIWELRDEWRSALLAFEWGEDAWGRHCVDETTRELMVWILGNHSKFKAAWGIIRRHMRRSETSARRILLLMIDRYAAAGHPRRAIRTFRFMEKFETIADKEAYYALLNSLCNHGNVEEAEEFMLTSKNFFPLETKSFNIILGGWCSVWVDVHEAKRIWRNMAEHCVAPDAASYSHMVSCFAKVGNLFDSVRLYHEMRKRGLVLSREVYNALIYVLVRENCFREAHNLFEKMKQSFGRLDSATYISLIRALK